MCEVVKLFTHSASFYRFIIGTWHYLFLYDSKCPSFENIRLAGRE
jgi:hypothetical protein